MIDIKLLRDKKSRDEIVKAAKDKGVNIQIDLLMTWDREIRELLVDFESIRAEKNNFSKTITQLSSEEKKKAIAQFKERDSKYQEMASVITEKSSHLRQLLFDVPNPARSDVKVGKDESENEVLRTVGSPTQFSFSPKDYLTLASERNLIDIPRATKVSGTRFAYLKNELVILEFAMVQWVMKTLFDKGFSPVVPPVLIKNESMEAMGYLARGGDSETYHFEKDGLYLVGTSEQSVGPMHRGEILKEEDLPKRYVSFSTCFRREAGSYGKDTKGILRVHQFDKIEMFSFTTPEKSDEEHEYLLSLEESFMKDLKIPYQVVKMCTGDLGDPAARKYDIESWIPSEGKYRETHSTSTCTDFQARRLDIRFRRKQTGKNEFVHMLNGTAFAIGRILIAIMENFQQADGSIVVPSVLHPFTGGLKIIEKKQ